MQYPIKDDWKVYYGALQVKELSDRDSKETCMYNNPLLDLKLPG